MPDNNLNNKHVSLYRKYRPQKFSDIAGQAAAVDMLVSALLNSGTGHAYLFSGPRGCGKTTAARLLAKSLNCLNHNSPPTGEMSPSGDREGIEPCNVCENCLAITNGESLDVVEIDGASNNSVDEARELKSQANLAPFNSKYKIYIIDEVHMLSIAAFNALLKIMEEPPDYVVFILATTEPHKVPVTIRSRCQHVPFHRINVQDIFKQLNKICDAEHENIKSQPEALWEIARQADGGMRDALSILEQVINSSGDEITIETVERTLGAGSRPELEKWLAGVLSGDDNYYINLKKIIEACTSPEHVFEELFSIGRNLWLASMWPDIVATLDVSEFESEFLKKYYRAWRPDKLKLFLNAALRLIKQSRLDFSVDVLLGMFTLELDAIINETIKSHPSEEKLSGSPSSPPPLRGEANSPPSGFNATSCVEVSPSSDREGSIIEGDWKIFSPDDDKKLISAAHDKNFVLYCILLDAEFYSYNDKLLLKFDNEHCYETARIERNIFILENILIDLKLNFKSICCNLDKNYFEYKIEADADKTRQNLASTLPPLIGEVAVRPEGSSSLNLNAKSLVEASRNEREERSIAGEFAHVLGGTIVMVKSGEESNYDDGDSDTGYNDDEDND